MKEILTLAGYEYKKIFQRKVSLIALGAVLVLTLFSGAAMLLGQVYVEGEIVESHGEQLKDQRQAVEELAGIPIDDKLLGEAELAYGNIMSEDFCMDTGEGWEVYKASIYPYSFIQNMSEEMKKDYGSTEQTITGEEFYRLREAYMEQMYEREKLSLGEIAKHTSEMKKLDTPVTYGWTNGYQRYNQLVFMDGMFLAFAVAICIAPLFAGEYTSHVDQLMLTSKYGKNKAISAKLLTGFSFAFLAAFVMNLLLLLEIGILYGLENWNLPIQSITDGFFLSVPINLLTMTVIVVVYQTLATCMIGAVVIFCSQKMKSPFGVIIVASLLIFVPLFLMAVPSDMRFFYLLIRFLPNGVMEGHMIFDDLLFQIGNGYFYIYQVVPIVWIILMAGMGILVYKGFQKRQIGR